MYAVILAGGSGTRLWPLSREKFPKQYLPLVPVQDDRSSPLPPSGHHSRKEKINIPTSLEEGNHIPSPREEGNHIPYLREEGDHIPSPREEGNNIPSLREEGNHIPSFWEEKSHIPSPREEEDQIPSPLRGEGQGGGEKGQAGKQADQAFSPNNLSLFQATIKRVVLTVPPEQIIIVTHTEQAQEIKQQLASIKIEGPRLLAEPEARNTAPAIGLAARFLLNETGPETIIAVLPSDHLIPDQQQFAELLRDGEFAAKAYGLVTFGIRPNYPETGFGYICCGEHLNDKTYRVERFVEKPDMKTAEQYFSDSRYLWNSGMFVFHVGSLLEAFKQHLPATSAALDTIDFNHLETLPDLYHKLEKTSIDYGILEKAANVTVIPTAINWSDLGSWEAYYQVSVKDDANNYLKGEVLAVDTRNSLIYGESRLIGTVGLNNLVIIDTADALLVCDRGRTQEVKEIVGKLHEKGAVEAREHRTIYRPWGSYTSLEISTNYQVKRINVNPGARLSLQSHKHRAENWVVVAGEALVTINEQQIVVRKGESAYIPRGARHRMENRGQEPLVLIEVQNGDYLGEDDIERYEDDYGRTETPSLTSGAFTGIPSSSTEKVSHDTPSSSTEKVSHDIPSSSTERVSHDTPSPSTGIRGSQDTPSPLRGEGRGGGENKVSPTALTNYNHWLAQPDLDPSMKEELLVMQNDPEQIENHFGRELVFGTGGMRGIIGPGLNRINCYIIRRATQGLANYLNSQIIGQDKASQNVLQVAIAYDTRRFSAEFAEEAALVLAANGIKTLMFSAIRPTPMLSFTTRALQCAAGIVITASHNPPDYNGYKVYGPDGGQAVSPLVDQLIAAIEKVDLFTGVKTCSKKEAIQRGLFALIDPALDQNYLEQVKALSLSNPDQCLKVVFTALHGTGSVYVPNLLLQTRCIELHLVEEQMKPDYNFSTVRVPNPEDPAALSMALDLAKKIEADLVLATDPDCDRVGTAIRSEDGNYIIISGNQMGALLIEYICSRHRINGTMPADPVLVKTIVTGDLGRRVAESYGLQIVETLTGFKFIGDRIKHFEEAGEANFLFGYEESCGYLTGTFVRDKDGVIASFLIAEMTAYYKEKGLNLLQVLEQIQQRVGYHRDELLTVELEDISEAGRHVDAFKHLPREFAGRLITEKRDYELGKGWKPLSKKEFNLTLPRSPVLHYTLEDGSWFAVRPSGTEPKVKFYLSVCAATAVEADQKMAILHEAVLKKS